MNRYWQSFVQALEFDIETRIVDEGRSDLREMAEVVEFGEGEVMRDDDLTVTSLRVDHPPVTECFALRFEHAGTSVVFSADTAFFPPLAQFARGADILLHEAMLEEGVERLVTRTGNGARLKEHLMASHSLAGEAGTIAARAGVGRLVLNHLIPADDPEIGEADWHAAVRKTWHGPLTIGRDGLVVVIEDATVRNREDLHETGDAEERFA